MVVAKHIILRKRPEPVRVNLPDGRSFTSKWERVSRKQLPINIRITRNRNIGPRRNNRAIYLNQAAPTLKKIRNRRKQEVLKRLGPVYDRLLQQQRGSGLASDLAKTGLELGSRALGSEFGRRLINKGIDSIPSLFRFGTKKVKNENIKRALESEIADMVVNEAQNRVRKKYDSTNLFG